MLRVLIDIIIIMSLSLTSLFTLSVNITKRINGSIYKNKTLVGKNIVFL